MSEADAPCAPGPLLRFVGVEKGFGGVQAVRGFSMDIYAGGVTGLIGPNGAGKTTVFDLASGFLVPDRGSIYLGDTEITGRNPEQIFAIGLGRTFQELRVFESLSVYENLAVALERSKLRRRSERSRLRQEICEVLDDVALGDRIGHPARILSYAEKKLLSLARILVSRPRLMLLDEPASGLDDAARAVLVRVIRRASELGHKVILIEHNLEVVRELVDDVAFLNLGQVIAHGTLAEITSRADLTELYFGGQV